MAVPVGTTIRIKAMTEPWDWVGVKARQICLSHDWGAQGTGVLGLGGRWLIH